MSRLDAARALLERAVADRVTPGAQLAVRFADGTSASLSIGALDYEAASPPVTARTVYDLASVSKLFTALSLVRIAHREGVDLGRPIASVLSWTRDTPAGGATLLELLSHRAGLVHWAPFYRSVSAELAGSPVTRRAVLDAVAMTPRGPTGTVRYSDLGYILLGEALEVLGGASLDAVVAREVSAPLGLPVAYRGLGPSWRDEALAPTELCAWRGRVVRGEVHDENAYALGGRCGHAGLFGTADAVAELGARALACLEGDDGWFAPERMRWMIEARTGGAHRVGWDARSEPSPSSGAKMGPRTFGHLGFTGTSLWCDPDARLVVAFISNRVHPTRENQGIRALRPRLHDAVIDAAR